jgi:hypothetical protein
MAKIVIEPHGILPNEKSLQKYSENYYRYNNREQRVIQRKKLERLTRKQPELNWTYTNWISFSKIMYKKEQGYRPHNFHESKSFGYDQWKFPGQGDPYETCGEEYWKGCLDIKNHPNGEAYIQKGVNNCHRAECPECFDSWLVETAKSTERRIKKSKITREQFKQLKKLGIIPISALYNHYNKAIHVTVSPHPRDWWRYKSDALIKKERRKIDRITKQAGMIGYSKIYHPNREKCTKCGGNKKLGDLKKCEKCGHDKFYWHFAPHWHLIGYGWITKTKEIYQKTGYVIVNHRVRKDIGATVYYQLTHCGIKKGFHAITWVGILSWKTCKIPPEEKEYEKCPYDGNRLRKVTYYMGKAPKNKELQQIKHGQSALTSPNGWRYSK